MWKVYVELKTKLNDIKICFDGKARDIFRCKFCGD